MTAPPAFNGGDFTDLAVPSPTEVRLLNEFNASHGYAVPPDTAPDATDRDASTSAVAPVVQDESDPAIAAESAARERLMSVLDDPAFWESRNLMRRVRQHARARLVPPWGVFGYVLTHACATLLPSYVLPPIVGGHASLNTFCAFVGPSGQGKGGSRGAARHLLDAVGPTTPRHVTAGTGEGLAKTFAMPADPDAPVVQSAIMDIAEVDTLDAIATRQGSTLLDQLRQAWSGEALGFNNASKDTRTNVPAHAYRLAVTVGVQPDRAAVLLDDAAGGTPQRFVWLPMWDPAAQESEPPAEPPPLTWSPPAIDILAGYRVVEVADDIRAWIVARRREQLASFDTTLDAHAPLARLKLAALLALLDNRTCVASDDWNLAAQVLAVSDATRDLIKATTAATEARARIERAGEEARRRVAVDDATHGVVVERIMRKLEAAVAPVAKSTLRSGLSRQNRETFDEVMPALVAAGRVGLIDEEYHGRSVEKFYPIRHG